MALGKKERGFHGECECLQGVSEGVEGSGKTLPPPFHIASLLSLPPSSAPDGAGTAPVDPVYHIPPTVPEVGSADCNLLGGSADWSFSSLSSGSLKTSFQQQPQLTPVSLSPPFPPPPLPLYYPPPSMFHVCYKLSGDLPSTCSCCSGAAITSNPSLPPPLLSPSPSTQSRYRTTYTRKQLDTLEGFFSEKQYINFEERYQISREIGVNEKQVKMWFQNRRTKMKKENSRPKRHSGCYRNRGVSQQV